MPWLRLFVNRYMSNWILCVVLMAMSVALSSTRRMFCYPRSLYDILVLLSGLYIPDLAVLPTIGLMSFWWMG